MWFSSGIYVTGRDISIIGNSIRDFRKNPIQYYGIYVQYGNEQNEGRETNASIRIAGNNFSGLVRENIKLSV
jgi:hypothetical protein